MISLHATKLLLFIWSFQMGSATRISLLINMIYIQCVEQWFPDHKCSIKSCNSPSRTKENVQLITAKINTIYSFLYQKYKKHGFKYFNRSKEPNALVAYKRIYDLECAVVNHHQNFDFTVKIIEKKYLQSHNI